MGSTLGPNEPGREPQSAIKIVEDVVAEGTGGDGPIVGRGHIIRSAGQEKVTVGGARFNCRVVVRVDLYKQIVVQ